MKFFLKWNKKVSLLYMYRKGIHLGKNINKTDPRAIVFIKNYRNKTPIMDLNISIWVIKLISSIVLDIMFKKQKMFFFSNRQDHFLELNILKYNQIYLNLKNSWYGGFLTNFKNISVNSEIFKKNRNLNNFHFLPSLVFIIASGRDNWVVNESNTLKIPNSMIVTNYNNIEGVDYPIPAGSRTSEMSNFLVNILNFYMSKGVYLEKLYTLSK